MIVQCEKCEAKFNLDDSLIPERGRKVKCSKCQNVFRVEPPLPVPPPETIESLDTGLDEDFESLGIEEEAAQPPSEPASEQAQEYESTVKIDLAERDELSFEEEEEPFEEPLARRKSPLRPILRVAFVAILLAVIIWQAWTHRDRLPFLSRLSESPTDNLIIDRKELVGKWEKNGQIFVMIGSVQNHSNKPRAFVKVQGMLLDRNGNALKETWAYCGNPIPTEDLRTKTPDEILKETRNRNGLQDMNKLVGPNTSIPFTVVFFEQPEGVESFGAKVIEATIPES